MTSPATLALDTSGDPASVAVALDARAPGAPALEVTIPGPRPDSARLLILTIDGALRSAGIEKTQVKTILFGAGPGSFTGLRVGATAARTLAFASGARLAAYPSMAAIALRAFAEHPEAARVAVIQDALRGDVAFALYERGPRFPHERVQPRLSTPAEFLALAGENLLLVSPDPDLVAANLGKTRAVLRVAPSAEALLALHASGAPALAHAVPLYLRASAAEEKARAQRPAHE